MPVLAAIAVGVGALALFELVETGEIAFEKKKSYGRPEM
jgi:hypothetical protein